MQFAPLLPPLTALFLHFMDESDCYTCMHALVNSRRPILDQSRWDYEVMAQTFQDSLKLYSVSKSVSFFYITTLRFLTFRHKSQGSQKKKKEAVGATVTVAVTNSVEGLSSFGHCAHFTFDDLCNLLLNFCLLLLLLIFVVTS